jgi:type II secretory pathway pseudopilin PulG
MSFQFYSRRKASRPDEGGYILLTLVLVMALIAIFAATLVSSITFDIKRDREEEMVHRGTQYSRAIRAYFRKFQRYPSRIEDLENTSNQRFLRKRYKDPLNCKPKCQDFKLLHYGEVQMAMSAGIGGGTIPGANPIGAQGGLNGSSGSSLGQNSQTSNTAAGTDPSQSGSDSAQPGSQPGVPGDSPNSSGTSGETAGQGGVFGGNVPIVGVASFKKDATIREFNHKRKYNEWYFIYDPGTDRGTLITTPYQPQLQTFGQQGGQNLNGQNVNGQPNSGFGNGIGAQGTGMQNNPTQPTNGFGAPNPPSNPPQQQQ